MWGTVKVAFLEAKNGQIGGPNANCFRDSCFLESKKGVLGSEHCSDSVNYILG